MDGAQAAGSGAGTRGGPGRPGEIAREAQRLARAGNGAEAAAMIEQLLAQVPRNLPALRAAAIIADQARDLDGALARWETVRKLHPAAAAGYVGALRTMRRFDRLDLAQPVLDAGMAKVGGDAEFVATAAELAGASQRFDRAETLWQRAVSLAPDKAEYALALALTRIGQRQGRAQNLQHILAQLAAHHARFPDFAPAFTAHLDVLRQAQRFDEARALSAEWCARFPDEAKLVLARASLHEEMGRPDLALDEIAAARARLAPTAEMEAAYIRALSCAGRTGEADKACAAALQTYANSRHVWLEYVRLASRAADWDACVTRLQDAIKVMPRDRGLVEQLRFARLQAASPETVEARPAELANFFDRFESLGGSGMGCEFGMVQRRLGSEGIGLLRWARTNPPEMLAALQCGFEGVGDEAYTEVVPVRIADHEEYGTRDKRFMLESHTFIRTSDAPADRMFVQTCRRLRFLRTKLLEDLASGERIFVYRCNDPIGDDTVVAMQAALAKYGDNALVCVMRAHGAHKAGTMRVIGPMIYVGYVSHFALDRDATTGSDVEGWRAVCVAAEAAWQQHRRPGS